MNDFSKNCFFIVGNHLGENRGKMYVTSLTIIISGSKVLISGKKECVDLSQKVYFMHDR